MENKSGWKTTTKPAPSGEMAQKVNLGKNINDIRQGQAAAVDKTVKTTPGRMLDNQLKYELSPEKVDAFKRGDKVAQKDVYDTAKNIMSTHKGSGHFSPTDEKTALKATGSHSAWAEGLPRSKKATGTKTKGSNLYGTKPDSSVGRNVQNPMTRTGVVDLEEKVTHKEFGPMMDEFVSFASDHLGLKSLPTIRYKDQGERFASFGGYNPSTSEIVIQTKGRHPMDVLRTLAHELVHHKQRENGEITDDNVEESGRTGSKIENHANAKAGVMMREFGRKNSDMYESGALVESFITESATPKRIKPANRARYKALFYVGGPGSGKDYVAKQTGYGHGLTEINSDHAFEHLLGREGLSKTMPPEETERRTPVRAKAKSLTKVRQAALLSSGRGVIINTTGADHEKIGKMRDELGKRGYDTKMVFVNTSNEVSRQRNIDRGKAGGRTVPEPTRQEYWDKAQEAKGVYQKMFGNHFHHVDNSMDINTASDDEKAAKQGEFTSIFKNIRGWASSKPENPTGRAAVEAEISKRRKKSKVEEPAAPTVKPRQTVFGKVSPEVNAAAKGLGLKHWGAGYFGPRKKSPTGQPVITHREVSGKLTRVSPKKKPFIPQTVEEENLRQWFQSKATKGPKKGTKGWVQVGGKFSGHPCARQEGQTSTPKCRPSDEASKMTKKEKEYAFRKKNIEDPNQPQKTGGAKPTMVKTYKEIKEAKDACYHKVKARYDVWPSAYASGALVKCRKVGAANWGNKSDKKKTTNESFEDFLDEEYGAGFWGTDHLAMNYVAGTPGQKYWKGPVRNAPNSYDTLLGRTIYSTHPLLPEESNKKMKKKKMVRKQLAQEEGVTSSASDSVLVSPTGVGPTGGGGLGPEYGIGRSGMLGIAGTPYGTGMPANFSPYGVYGIAESVADWAAKLETQSRFVKKYGPLAEQKLVETMKALSEGYEKGIAYGMIPTQGYKDDMDRPVVGEDTPAWQRKEGKDPEGGLNKKGVASYRRQNPGSKLQTAVTTEPSKLKPGSKKWKRRKSFCARMGGMPGPMKDEKGRPTRKALSLRKWNCEE